MLKQNRLGKELKLRAPSSFQKVYKNAQRFRFKGLNLLVCKNELPYSRIGIVISKKQIPKAVDRNRIRRVVREYFRVNQHELAICFDFIFVVYSELEGVSNLEITKCLEVLWTKLVRFYEKG